MTILTISGILIAGFLLTLGLFVSRLTVDRRCPSCKQAHSLERAPRPALVKSLLFFVPTRGYRCYACQKTFVKIG